MTPGAATVLQGKAGRSDPCPLAPFASGSDEGQRMFLVLKPRDVSFKATWRLVTRLSLGIGLLVDKSYCYKAIEQVGPYKGR